MIKRNGLAVINWFRSALKQFDKALDFILENGIESYADKLREDILYSVEILADNHEIHPVDKYKKDNDGSYRAFERDEYRVFYNVKK